jgi:hypothetical protein
MGKKFGNKPPDAMQGNLLQGDVDKGLRGFGKRTTRPPHEFIQWDYLQDPRNAPPLDHELSVQSLRTTKFTTGIGSCYSKICYTTVVIDAVEHEFLYRSRVMQMAYIT